MLFLIASCNVKPFEHTILVSCRFAPPIKAKKDARLAKPGVFIEDYRLLYFPNFLTDFGIDATPRRRHCAIGVRAIAMFQRLAHWTGKKSPTL
jgi:hypothetical protein